MLANRVHRMPDITDKAAGRRVTWFLGRSPKRATFAATTDEAAA
jgi:hypothetical protein